MFAWETQTSTIVGQVLLVVRLCCWCQLHTYRFFQHATSVHFWHRSVEISMFIHSLCSIMNSVWVGWTFIRYIHRKVFLSMGVYSIINMLYPLLSLISFFRSELTCHIYIPLLSIYLFIYYFDLWEYRYFKNLLYLLTVYIVHITEAQYDIFQLCT